MTTNLSPNDTVTLPNGNAAVVVLVEGDRVLCRIGNASAWYSTDVLDIRPVLASIKLTPFQRQEVEHGLDVDYADNERPMWGRVRYTGKTTAYLDVLDFNGAVYRVTSSRDICADNSTDDMLDAAEHRAAAAHARSLTLLVVRLVDAAGGPDALDANVRRWLKSDDFSVPTVEEVPADGDAFVLDADGHIRFFINGDDMGVAEFGPLTSAVEECHAAERERAAALNPVPVLDVEDAIAHLSDVCDLPPIDVLIGFVRGHSLIVDGRVFRPENGTVSVYVDLSKPSDLPRY